MSGSGIDMSKAEVGVTFNLSAPEVQAAILIAASNIAVGRTSAPRQAKPLVKEMVTVANQIRDLLIAGERE